MSKKLLRLSPSGYVSGKLWREDSSVELPASRTGNSGMQVSSHTWDVLLSNKAASEPFILL